MFVPVDTHNIQKWLKYVTINLFPNMKLHVLHLHSMSPRHVDTAMFLSPLCGYHWYIEVTKKTCISWTEELKILKLPSPLLVATDCKLEVVLYEQNFYPLSGAYLHVPLTCWICIKRKKHANLYQTSLTDIIHQGV